MTHDLKRARSATEMWEAALGELQIQVNKANYRTWLQQTIGLSYQDGQFIIGVPNTFVAEYLDWNQRSLIERTLASLTNSDTKIQFQVQPTSQSGTAIPGKRKENAASSSQIYLPGFNSRYTFDSFVVGSGNRLALTAAMAVAENPGHSFNPLVIYAGAGLGKTHLLHAIGHAAQATNHQVLYASAERYTNEFVYALRQKNTEEFHRKYRNVDILLMDDINFLGGKAQTEESFFHTFNELHDANRQLVITSGYPPQSIPLLENRLRSRLEWGLTVDIQSPDLTTRLAILDAKTKSLGVPIPANVIEYIAQRSRQSIRELEGSLNRVVAYTQLVCATPTIELASQALMDITRQLPASSAASLGQIIEVVAYSFQLTPADLVGRKRDKETALARQVAMYLLRQETKYSLEQIGDELGGRDHSTVIHACAKIADNIGSSPDLKRKIEDIQRELRSADPKPSSR